MQDLPSSALSAYSDLLTSLLEAPPPSRGVSAFTRPVKGRDYWYVQSVLGERKTSIYLGPDDEPTRSLVARAKAAWSADEVDHPVRERLVATCIAAGCWTPSPTDIRVYEALAQAGVFAIGGVLVGTHAFLNLGNVLGIRWDSGNTATEDIDIAKDMDLRVATPGAATDLLSALREQEPAFLPVPAFDREHPSTSYKVRGKKISVSLLTPGDEEEDPRPIPIVGLGASAQPMRHLEFLLEDSILAAAPYGRGVLVRLPDPARFAVHKLAVSQMREPAFATKARKDLEQARSVLDILERTNPHGIATAVHAATLQDEAFYELVESGRQALAAG
jgi:hypothetical protein